MLRYSLTCLVFAAAAALTACGGGGAPAMSTPPPVTIQAPAIATQPAAQSVLAGQSATFTVAATGDGLVYQWQRDAKDIAGATGASYTLANAQAADSGASFTVVVKNGGGSVTSAAAALKVTAVATMGQLSLLAGPLGGSGNLDGPIGRFSPYLSHIAASPSGTLYLNDQVPWRALRVVTQTPGQDAVVTTLPREQSAVVGAVDAAGNRYEVDLQHEYDAQQIYKRTPDGVRTLFAGSVNGGSPVFQNIRAMVIDAAGTLYVADDHNHTIYKITPQGTVTLLAGSPGQEGNQDGTGDAARFNMGPAYLAVDKAGNLYTPGFTPNYYGYVIRKITPEGRVTTLPALHADGATSQGNAPTLFQNIKGIGVDASGNVYVLSGNLRRIGPDGVVSHFTPSGGADLNGPFGSDSSLAQDGAGNFYVASSSFQQVLRVTPAGEVRAIAGKALQGGSVDGKGSAAQFANSGGAGPASSLYVDAQGNVFFTEGERVRKVTAAGDVSTLALPVSASSLWPLTYYTSGYAGGGDLLAYEFGVLSRVDANGNRRLLAGHVQQGTSALLDGVGASAGFVHPQGFVADGQGNVYCVDQTAQWQTDRAWHGVIRKISADSTVTTLPVANLPELNSWFVDRDGKLIMATSLGAVLRLEADNSLTTLRPALAEADAVSRNTMTVVAGDRGGNLYVADTIRTADKEGVVLHKITPGGVDTVIAGRPDTKGVVLGRANSLNVVGSMTVADDGAVYLMIENSLLKLTP